VIPAEPPTRPVAATRWSGTPIAIAFGVFAVVLVVAFGLMTTNSRHAAQSSYDFVGSAIKPTTSLPAAPFGGEREAARAEVVAGAVERQRAVRADGQAPAELPAGQPKVEPIDRKIVYTARLDLVVKSLDPVEKQVDDLLAANGGRLVSSESRGDAGSKRTASFKLEVPAAKFRALVAGLRALGVPERDKVDSDDLTEEYVDVQARVRHLKAEEDNLIKLLGERARSVEEQLAIRRQIQPLREQIERAEGRQKYIEARAAFSTVTLSLREEANYVPPTADPPPAPPTFGERVSKTFAASWGMLVTFGEGLALFGVALGPWLAVMLPVGLVGWWTARRFGRSTPRAA
jgi:hypothetical protein